MSRPRRPDHRHRTNTAEVLRLVADLLTAPDASRVLSNIVLAAEEGYSSRGSTVAAAPHNETDEDGEYVPPPTPTERPVLTPDREAAKNQRLLSHYYELGDISLELLNGFRAWDSKRSVKVCSRCGHPLPVGRQRCQQTDENGVRCGASADAWPDCKVCGTEMKPGDRHSGMHARCRANAGRKLATRDLQPSKTKMNRGTDTISVKDLEYGGRIVEGTYVAD